MGTLVRQSKPSSEYVPTVNGLMELIHRATRAYSNSLPVWSHFDEATLYADVEAYANHLASRRESPTAQGWQLVPIEPTPEMLRACNNGPGQMVLTKREIYRAMLSAAPHEPPTESKVDYVRSQPQTRNHHCHWPGCDKQCQPAMWGCKAHWFKLPASLRAKVWATYRPGQEVSMTPSKAYLDVANEVQKWIRGSGHD